MRNIDWWRLGRVAAWGIVAAWGLGVAMVAAAPEHVRGKGPVQVFILAGQSNMQGQGVVSLDDATAYNGGKGNLVWSMEHSASADKMRHLKDRRGEWMVRDDVFISYKVDGVVRHGGLTVGFTSYGNSSHIGPELEFGHVVGDALDQPVLLIKTAWGGKSLHVDFRPPRAGGETGPCYLQMVAEVREALAALGKRPYQLAGFVWMQGWNDMCDEKAIPEYADNLVDLVRDLRAEFKAPKLPVVIGELGNDGPATEGSAMQRFRDQQRAGARRIARALFVETSAFARPPEMSPNPTHGHHWYGNAESYFLVGEALGKAMLKQLRP